MNPQAAPARGARPSSGPRGRWQKLLELAPLLSRILAALFGGYLLAALASIATLALTTDAAQGVIAGQSVSFLVYAGAVIWVFAARSAARAWAGLLLAALPLALAAWWATQGLAA